VRQIDYFLKQDDVGGVIEATLYDASGAVVNLVGKTVDFHMVATSSTTPKVSTPATIVDAAGGRVNYTFAAPDTDTPGYFELILSRDRAFVKGQMNGIHPPLKSGGPLPDYL